MEVKFFRCRCCFRLYRRSKGAWGSPQQAGQPALALRAICGCRVARDSERPRLPVYLFMPKSTYDNKDAEISVSFRNAVPKISA